jgi:hypothetical protein
MRGKLEELLRAARALPGPAAAEAAVRAEALGAAAAVDTAPLRGRLAALVLELAERAGPALDAALVRAGRAWDQVDALAILDDDWRERARALAGAWRAVGGAEAVEAILVLDTVTALVALVERRLAAFVRLRGEGELRPGGRAFLDVSAALAELAGRWS